MCVYFIFVEVYPIFLDFELVALVITIIIAMMNNNGRPSPPSSCLVSRACYHTRYSDEQMRSNVNARSRTVCLNERAKLIRQTICVRVRYRWHWCAWMRACDRCAVIRMWRQQHVFSYHSHFSLIYLFSLCASFWFCLLIFMTFCSAVCVCVCVFMELNCEFMRRPTQIICLSFIAVRASPTTNRSNSAQNKFRIYLYCTVCTLYIFDDFIMAKKKKMKNTNGMTITKLRD